MNSTATIAETLLEEVFEEVSAGSRWRDACADGAGPRVVANGLSLPVVRVDWDRVDDFFDQLFSIANGKLFANRLPKCQRRWNTRFRRLAGRIDCSRRLIELSGAHYESCGSAALGVVLLHEMIHLALHTDGLRFGHTPEFKRRSYALGMMDIRHELPLPERIVETRTRHLYRCVCGRVIESTKRFRQPRACAACCRKFNRGRYHERFRLQYVGQSGGA